MSESPAELLDSNVVLRPKQIAIVLDLRCVRGKTKGEPDTRKVREMIRDGSIWLVDDSQPPSRWTVATAEIRRYIEQGPRRAERRSA